MGQITDRQTIETVRKFVEEEVICTCEDPTRSGYLAPDLDPDDIECLLSNIDHALGDRASLGLVDKEKARRFRTVQGLTDYLVSCVTED